MVPPSTVSSRLVGDAEEAVSTVTVWLSREASEDARAAALDTADDLALLRRMMLRTDWPHGSNLHSDIRTSVLPRERESVVVLGRLVCALDYVEAT